MLDKLNTNDFEKIYRLMEISFPEDEYRSYEEQVELLNNPLYSVYVFYSESRSIKAFISIWEFEEFAYIEHFAVDPDYRNGGIGAKVLNELSAQIKKMICLEVEPPENEISRGRIGFYQRNNFFLNEYPYMQPPYSKGKKAIPLLVMTTGSKINRLSFEHIKDVLYSEVYKCNTSSSI